MVIRLLIFSSVMELVSKTMFKILAVAHYFAK